VRSRDVQDYAAFSTQFRLLFIRTAANAYRNKLILAARFGQAVVLSLIVGLIFLQLGEHFLLLNELQRVKSH
jgi:hypothetical protein